MRKVFLAALGAFLLSVVFVESASAQRAWGYRGAAWGPRVIGVRSAGFYGRPFVRPGWGMRTAGFYGRPYLRPGLGWRTAGFYGWRRPYVGYGWRRPLGARLGRGRHRRRRDGSVLLRLSILRLRRLRLPVI